MKLNHNEVTEMSSIKSNATDFMITKVKKKPREYYVEINANGVVVAFVPTTYKIGAINKNHELIKVREVE